MVRATTNPYGRGHAAVKERYKIGTVGPGHIIKDPSGRERCYVHGDISENTTLLANDPDYVSTLDGIKDPNRRKAWRQGSWDINIGAFLEHCWDPAKHIVEPFPIPPHWKCWRAMDWGYAKPYCVLWFAKDPEGKTYIWREMYGIAKDDSGNILPNVGSKETPDTVARRIAEREKHDERVGIEMGPSFTGPDLFHKAGGQYGAQNSHAETFRRAGVKFRPAWAAKGSRAAGAMEIIRLLENDLLAVFSNCTHWLRTVPTIEPDSEDPDDVDTEAEDHAWDTTRQGLVRVTRSPDELDESLSGNYHAGGVQIQANGTHRIDR